MDAGLRYRLPKRFGFLVAGVNNLTDERSTYEATDAKNLSIRPGRVVYAPRGAGLPVVDEAKTSFPLWSRTDGRKKETK